MRLRIENNWLGIKITEAELNQLIDGQPLSINALLKVNLAPVNGPSKLLLKENVLDFSIGTEDLNALMAMGKNRAGLSLQFDELVALLQVDIRSDSRPMCRL